MFVYLFLHYFFLMELTVRLNSIFHKSKTDASQPLALCFKVFKGLVPTTLPI